MLVLLELNLIITKRLAHENKNINSLLPKRAKVNLSRLISIYTRITFNGKRIELSNNRFVEITKWSTEADKMKGNLIEARSINSHLDMLRIQIIDMQMELVLKKMPVITETLKS